MQIIVNYYLFTFLCYYYNNTKTDICAVCGYAQKRPRNNMQTLLQEIAQKQSAQEAQLARIEQYTLLAAKQVLTAEDVVLLTGLKKSYLYKLTALRQIPHYKPNGKCIFFDRGEIEQWQKQNRVATELECEQGAIKHALQ